MKKIPLGAYDGYPYRSFAPKRLKALRGIVFFPVQLNQNLRAVPASIDLKVSGGVMRIFSMLVSGS